MNKIMKLNLIVILTTFIANAMEEAKPGKNVLIEGTLSEITDTSKTWTKFISRSQDYYNCLGYSLNEHQNKCSNSLHIYNPTHLTNEQFKKQMDGFVATYPKNMGLDSKGFHSYVEKEIINPKTQLHIFGDLHADIHSLIKMLNNLKVKGVISDDLTIADNHRLVFLGDCGDRGDASCEVWTLLMRLRILNKQKCIIVRGNHETEDVALSYGFLSQIEKSWFNQPAKREDLVKYCTFFNYLPGAFFLGCKDRQNDHANYMLLCHGGIEFGWNDHRFLNTASSDTKIPFIMDRDLFLKKHKISLKANEEGRSQKPGFLWNYYENDAEKTTIFKEGKYTFSKQFTEYVMKSWSNQNDWIINFKRMINACTYLMFGKRFLEGATYSVVANLRAHQHPGAVDFVKKSEQARIMKPLYTDGFGMLNHWRCNAQMYGSIPYFAVFTLKNTCCNTYGYPYLIENGTHAGKYLFYDNKSSMAHLTVHEKWQDWKLESEVEEIYTQDELPKETQGKLIGLEDLN